MALSSRTLTSVFRIISFILCSSLLTPQYKPKGAHHKHMIPIPEYTHPIRYPNLTKRNLFDAAWFFFPHEECFKSTAPPRTATEPFLLHPQYGAFDTYIYTNNTCIIMFSVMRNIACLSRAGSYQYYIDEKHVFSRWANQPIEFFIAGIYLVLTY